jgi:putative salt-induced outer membrane protein
MRAIQGLSPSAVVLGVLAAPMLLSPNDAAAEGWTGTGELGLAAARGNARSENVNAKLDFTNEDERWKHTFSASILRAKGEISGDFDGDGVIDERFELTANRWALGASSAIKMNERASWIAALRHERDDFSAYDNQSTFSIGYGYTFYKSDSGRLHAEIGPGYRRAELADTGETESNLIARGLIDWMQKISDTSELVNTLLVESGEDNTFAQNDFGVKVAINSSLALKAGLQVRFNSDTQPGTKSTDVLTTINLVYAFK